MRNGRDSELTSFYQGVEKRRDIVGGVLFISFFREQKQQKDPTVRSERHDWLFYTHLEYGEQSFV